MDAGPAKAGGVLHARLDGIDLRAADTDARLAVLVDYERCAGQLAAREYEVLALLDPGGRGSGDDWVREDVAAALGIAPGTARMRLAVARTLYHRLAATWRLLHDGALGVVHARVLAVAVEDYRLTDEQAAVVEEWVLRKPDLPVGQFKARIRYAMAKLAPVSAEQARAEAAADRAVWHTPGDRETGTLVIHGPAETTFTAWKLIDDHARQTRLPGDDRTVTQRRFDAFTDLFLHDHGWDTVHVHVDVTVPLDTLNGGTAPGDLTGYGPVSADTARTLAHTSGRWRRLTIDPATGCLLGISGQTYPPGATGRLTTGPIDPPPPAVPGYRPSAALARFVKALWRHCVFPGCGHRVHVDLDHLEAWLAGGETSKENLAPLCRRHHRLKHHAGWTLIANPNGSLTWTSPTGRQYTIWPHDYNGP